MTIESLTAHIRNHRNMRHFWDKVNCTRRCVLRSFRAGQHAECSLLASVLCVLVFNFKLNMFAQLEPLGINLTVPTYGECGVNIWRDTCRAQHSHCCILICPITRAIVSGQLDKNASESCIETSRCRFLSLVSHQLDQHHLHGTARPCKLLSDSSASRAINLQSVPLLMQTIRIRTEWWPRQ